MCIGTGVALQETCPPGAPETCFGVPGDEATGTAPSDDSEGIDSEGRVLPCEPVHRCLERAAPVARRHMPLTWRRDQVRGDPMRQRPPESWRGLVCLGPLYVEVEVFDVFPAFRGVNHSGHGVPPCPRMPSIGHGGCLLRSTPVCRHWRRRGGAVLSLRSMT